MDKIIKMLDKKNISYEVKDASKILIARNPESIEFYEVYLRTDEYDVNSRLKKIELTDECYVLFF